MTNAIFSFNKAERKQCKASILIEGLTGRGKSGLALCLATALAKGDQTKVFDIDTENGSIPLFTGLTSTSGGVFQDFQIANFTPDIGYKPSNYLLFRDAAINAGAEVVINDSISHAWSYQGGVLDMLNDLKKNNSRYQRDSYAAWGDDQIVQEKLKIFELLRDNRCHVISTVRVKEKMEYQTGANGKAELVSLGEQEIMQADVKYEPDLVLHMVKAGCSSPSRFCYPTAKVVKSRYPFLEQDQIYEFTPSLCDQIREYLEEGTSPEEIMAKQHKEFCDSVNTFLKANKTKQALWKMLCENEGYKDVKTADMPLDVVRKLYVQLTLD